MFIGQIKIFLFDLDNQTKEKIDHYENKIM
jgi:hypothetical protein